MTTTYAVETRALTKRYGACTVVDGLDLRLPTGVIAGFIGPNGSGKSTTLRMLLGLVRPSSGEGTVLGEPLTHPERYLSRVGALIEAPAFYPGLSGTANLRVLAALAGNDPQRVELVLDRVGLGTRGDDAYKRYSLGMKQRLGIAAALLGEPELLMLDEPTNGLDPSGIREMRDLLRTLAGEGLTVFVSSHLLGELEQVCDHLVMIESGHEVFQGPTAQLLAGSDELVLAPERPEDLTVLAGVLRSRGLDPATREGGCTCLPARTAPTPPSSTAPLPMPA
jgi:ABC-2 type transport system ATP-binding protein